MKRGIRLLHRKWKKNRVGTKNCAVKNAPTLLLSVMNGWKCKWTNVITAASLRPLHSSHCLHHGKNKKILYSVITLRITVPRLSRAPFWSSWWNHPDCQTQQVIYVFQCKFFLKHRDVISSISGYRSRWGLAASDWTQLCHVSAHSNPL